MSLSLMLKRCANLSRSSLLSLACARYSLTPFSQSLLYSVDVVTKVAVPSPRYSFDGLPTSLDSTEAGSLARRFLIVPVIYIYIYICVRREDFNILLIYLKVHVCYCRTFIGEISLCCGHVDESLVLAFCF